MITGGVDLLTVDGFTARLSYSQVLIVLATKRGQPTGVVRFQGNGLQGRCW